MLRRHFLSLAGASLAGSGALLGNAGPWGSSSTWSGGAKRPPNIVWIMADDMAWGDAGCYGQKVIQTPHIDRMAREGMRFTDAYAGCTVCAPSRSVLMTGLHTGHTPVRANPGGVFLLDHEVTVAEVLRQKGYRNGCFGKWGLGDIGTEGVPWKQGFDEFFGYLQQAHAHFYYPPYLYDNDKQFDLPANKGGKLGTHAHDLIAERTLDFIRKNHNAPFFCYAAWTMPHWEPQAPEGAMEPYRGKFEPEYEYVDKGGRLNSQKETFATYAGMVSRVDQGVGQILRLLKQLGLDDNTIVFFTSDNGGHSRQGFDREETRLANYGPFRGYKTTMYEGGLRVPMIARWPGKIPAGRVSGHPWMFMDAMPTFAEIAGVPAPDGIDGVSVLPTLMGGGQKPHEYLYWELASFNMNKKEWAPGLPPQALRMGDWKAVRPAQDAPLEFGRSRPTLGSSTDVGRAGIRGSGQDGSDAEIGEKRTPHAISARASLV
ncbi:MAG: arylsulfatase [Bryobacterales bacterium]|nr:arylsulfatase [Bryobacterales bacterium]